MTCAIKRLINHINAKTEHETVETKFFASVALPKRIAWSLVQKEELTLYVASTAVTLDNNLKFPSINILKANSVLLRQLRREFWKNVIEKPFIRCVIPA